MSHMSNTLHVLCIATNARYDENFPQPDMDDFTKTLKIVHNKLPELSPLVGSFEYYLCDYICGMYPEFKEPLAYFRSLVAPTQRGKRELLTQAAIKECFDKTRARYPELKDRYNLEQEPSPQQMDQLVAKIGPKQIRDMQQHASGVLAQMGAALLGKSRDFRLVHQFMEQFRCIELIAFGQITPEVALQYTHDSTAVTLGAKLAEMKKQGILDEHLNISDKNRFYKSDIITNFSIAGKRFDLAPTDPQPFTNRQLDRSRGK